MSLSLGKLLFIHLAPELGSDPLGSQHNAREITSHGFCMILKIKLLWQSKEVCYFFFFIE
jgi:hypothetical protein